MSGTLLDVPLAVTGFLFTGALEEGDISSLHRSGNRLWLVQRLEPWSGRARAQGPQPDSGGLEHGQPALSQSFILGRFSFF